MDLLKIKTIGFTILIPLLFLACNLKYAPFYKKNNNKIIPIFTNHDTTGLFVNSTIFNKQMKLLIDNGAPCSLFIDSSELNNFHIYDTITLINGVGKRSVGYITKIKHLKIANFLMKNEYFILSTIKPKQLKKNNVSGILGYNILNKYDYTIDFYKFNLLLTKLKRNKHINFKINPSSVSIPIEFNKIGMSFINVKIDNILYSIQIDYGSNGFISFNNKSLLSDSNNLKFLKVNLIETLNERYIDTSRIYVKDTIIFSNKILFTSIPFTIEKGDTNIIGMKFFKQFKRVSILNSNNTMVLSPVPINFNLKYKKINCIADQKNCDSCIIYSYIKYFNDTVLKINIGDKIYKQNAVEYVKLPLTKGYKINSNNKPKNSDINVNLRNR